MKWTCHRVKNEGSQSLAPKPKHLSNVPATGNDAGPETCEADAAGLARAWRVGIALDDIFLG